MTQLMVHGQKVDTVFELLGNNENAMTYSLGWALAKSGFFSSALAQMLEVVNGFSNSMHIRLQDHAQEKGYTDIELIDPGEHHIIIEAKRGFTVPGKDQLEKYADRLLARADTKAKPSLVVLAESDRDETWLELHVPPNVKGIPVRAISWRRFQSMALHSIAQASHEEKRLLKQLIQYLDKVTSMQNQNSNLVYVVSLNSSTFSDSKITFIDVVEEFGKYFHPVGGSKGGWPVEPPNYIAFRYHGALQSIHHIESYTAIEDYYPHFPVPENSPAGEPHYLYTLGTAIKPPHEVRTNDANGNYPNLFRSARKWCFLDLLLTCDSVAEAAGKTRERQAIAGMMEAA